MRKITLKINFIQLIVMLCGWLLLPTYGLTNQQFDGNRSQQQQQQQLLFKEILKSTTNRFMLDKSILRNSFNTDKNITSSSHLLSSFTPTPAVDTSAWQIRKADTYTNGKSIEESTVNTDAGGNVKIHNSFHYGINKSNQENISLSNEKQKPATPLLSNIEIVSSSAASIAIAAAAKGTLSNTSSSNSALNTTISISSPSYSASSSSPSSSSYFERVELQESLTHRKNEKLLLHRNKRYLLFPEGSSFQLGK